MKKHIFPLACLLFLVVIGFWRWFLSFHLLTAGDFLVDYLERTKEFFTYPAVWDTTRLFGFSNISLSFWPFIYSLGFLAHLNVSPAIIERIVFLWPSALFSVIGMYCLGYYLFRSRLAAVVAAIAYACNATMITTEMGILTVSTAVAFFPLLMLFFMLLLEKRKVLYSLLTGLTAFIVGFYDFRMLYVMFFILFFYLVYYLIFVVRFTNAKKELLQLAGLLFLVLVEVILLNIYWVIGLSKAGSISSNQYFNRGLIGQQFVNMASALTTFLYLWTGGKYQAFVIQPIILSFWLIPVISFLGLLYKPKRTILLFFAGIGLIGIFLSKQESEPFPLIYGWLYSHFPGFNAFRESTKFYFVTMFGYSVLIGGFSMIFIAWAKKMRQKVISFALLALIALIFLINLKPVITGEIDTLVAGRTIPQEYLDLKQFLMKDNSFSRTMAIPVAQRFIFYNTLHPIVGFINLPQDLQTLDPKILRLEGIKYVVLPSDPVKDIYGDWGPRQGYDTYIHTTFLQQREATASAQDKTFGAIKVWENPSMLPHLSTADDLIYISGSSSLASVVDLPSSERPAYYIEQNIPTDAPPAMARYLSDLNTSMQVAATKQYYIAQCVRCDVKQTSYDFIKFPFVRFYPDSIAYPIVIRKEKQQLSQAFADGPTALSDAVFLSLKRAIEIQGMFKKSTTESVIRNTIARRNLLMQRIDQLITKQHDAKVYNSNLVETYDYLIAEKRIFSDQLIDEEDVNAQLLEDMIYQLDTLLEKLQQEMWITQGNDKKLLLTVPTADTYSVSVKNDPTIDLNKSSLFVNTELLKSETSDKDVTRYGQVSLQKGASLVELQLVSENLIATAASSVTLSTSSSLQQISYPLRTLDDPAGEYVLSFDYRITSGLPPTIHVIDNSFSQDRNTEIKPLVDSQLHDDKDGKWHHSTSFFTPHYGTTQTVLNLSLSSGIGQESQTEIQNLSLIKVVTPTIVFEKATRQKLTTPPQMSFQEINPMYYLVHVHGATAPYMLSFSEGFDMHWKAYTVPASITDSPIATYLANSIQEMPYKNIFPLSSFFSSFTKNPLPDASHGPINEFGNGWLVKQKGDYTLAIVYEPEKYVLIGFFISLISGIVIIIATGYFIWRERR